MHASMLNIAGEFLKPDYKVFHVNCMLSQYVGRGIPLSFGMGKSESVKILNTFKDSCDYILDRWSCFSQIVDSIAYHQRVTLKGHVPNSDLQRESDPYLHNLSLGFQWPQRSVRFST